MQASKTVMMVVKDDKFYVLKDCCGKYNLISWQESYVLP